MNINMNIVHGVGYLLAAIGLYSALAVVFSQYCPERGTPAKEIKKMYLILATMLFGGMAIASLGIWLSLI